MADDTTLLDPAPPPPLHDDGRTPLDVLLRALGILDVLPQIHRDALSGMLQTLAGEPEDVLAQAGELPAAAGVVAAGSIELLRPATAPDLPPRIVGTILEHGVFGLVELAGVGILRHALRCGPEGAVVHLLHRDTLLAAVADAPDVAAMVAARLDRMVMARALKTAGPLADLPDAAVVRLAEGCRRRVIKAGTVLSREGEEQDTLFVVEQGRFAVTLDSRPGVVLAQAGSGSVLGEIAVLEQRPRTATLTAEGDGVVLELPGPLIRDLIAQESAFAQRMQGLAAQRHQSLADATAPPATDPPAVTPSATGPAVAAPPDPQMPRSDAPMDPAAARRAAVARYHPPRRLPAYQQHSEMDCGAACLVNVCAYFGKRISINTARELARVDQDGASMAALVGAARELGLEAEPFTSTMDHLRAETGPSIVNWKGYHWMVVYRVTDHHVTLCDPAFGLVKMPRAEFEKDWTGYVLLMTPTPAFDDLEETKPTLRPYLHYIQPHRRTIAEFFLAALVLQTLGILSPLFTRYLFDDVLLSDDRQWLWWAVGVLVGSQVFALVLGWVRDELVLRVSMSANMDILRDLYHRMLRLPMDFFERRRPGDITTRLNQQSTIVNFCTQEGLEQILNTLSVFAYLALMIYLDWRLTVLGLSFLGLNLLIVRIVGPRLRQLSREDFVRQAEMESHLIESLRGATVLKSLAADHHARWTLENLYAQVANLAYRQSLWAKGAEVGTGFLDMMANVLVLFIGGSLVMQGQMSIGELVAFTMVLAAVQGPIAGLVGAWENLQETLIAVERLNDIFDKKAEFSRGDRPADVAPLPRLTGHIDLRNVTFRYDPEAPSNVLANLSLTIPAGAKVAFVGRSGSGKSTVVRLLYGFYPVTSGRILVDGFDIRDAWPPDLRQQIAMVPQAPTLFRGSIRDNIVLGRSGVLDVEVERAARLAAAHDFISALPKGYDTPLIDGGANLSGGQRQRIAIARAFLADSPILVLDEATSALDTETERVVIENLRREFSDRTVIMIAHRLSTVVHADAIAVLNNGLVQELGSHHELMAQRGLYYHLAAQQLSGATD